MEKSIRAAIPALAAASLLAACSSNDHPYAHESMRHSTAAEQLFGTNGESYVPPSPVVTTQPVVVAEPVVVAPAAAAPVVVAPAAATPAVGVPAVPLTVPQPVSRLAPSDGGFAQQALSTDALEIELARIAFVRAQSPDVRAFARQMLIDHRDMAIRLDNFGLVRGYLIDWQIEPVDSNAITRLRSLDGASFDRAYMDEMVRSHERAVAMLETQAGSGRETAVIANATLPIVRHHLEMARDLRARL